jgi:uncharacterized damage-inducible protein DinB
MTDISREHLRELIHCMEWADAEVWRAVLVHGEARTDAKLRGLLIHLHMVQRGFLCVWQNEPWEPVMRRASSFDSVVDLCAWAQPYYAEAQRFLEGVDEGALTQGVTMPWVEAYQQRLGRTFSTPTLAETIFQVASHSTYHRGQVNARVREVGGEPPLVDYIAWVWFGRPEAEWSQVMSAGQ